MNKEERILIVGLGNPGDEYELTRHNAGFMFIDYLVSRDLKIGSTEKKFKQSFIYAFDENTLLLKPQTFMNNSGQAIKEAVKWFDISIEKGLVIVHDDLDIPLGKYKYHFARSPKDHNGVKSVEDHLGTKQFYRLRIGIENRKNKQIPGEKYVLEKFKKEELDTLVEVFKEIDLGSILSG